MTLLSKVRRSPPKNRLDAPDLYENQAVRETLGRLSIL